VYEEYFGLKGPPFSIAPDPRFLYMSAQHQEALAHLLYGMRSNGGFVLLTGEVGTGKTTSCRLLLEQIPGDTDVAFIINPRINVEEFLATLCDELGIVYPGGNSSVKVFVDRINAYLLDAHARSRRTVVIIEEAQNLSYDVLEQVRLLTNLETNERKLLQVIMIGQPELRDMLERPELRQLAQRITARYHLGPLTEDEVPLYIKHRLSVMGIQRGIFTDSACKTVFRRSSGIPRLINVICDRALLGAYVEGKDRIDRKMVNKAVSEVFGKGPSSRKMGAVRRAAVILVSVVALAALLTLSFLALKEPSTDLVSTDHGSAKTQHSVVSPGTGMPAPPVKDQSVQEGPYEAMFRLWGAVFRKDGGSACEQALPQGLLCIEDAGSPDDLRIMNRPAVVKLKNAEGKEQPVLLTALDGQSVTIAIDAETKSFTLGDFKERWTGTYTVLSKRPSGYQEKISPGYRGDFVSWIEEKLTRLQGRKIRSGTAGEYDEKLAGEVRKFQKSRGLKPDGVIGPRTILSLNADGPDGPVINRKGVQ
jgi:general secretion pathway protein A